MVERVIDLMMPGQDTMAILVDFKNSDVLVGRFFFATDPDGYKIEVIQRGGRFK